MASGEKIRLEFKGAIKELAEFNLPIAFDARIRRFTPTVAL